MKRWLVAAISLGAWLLAGCQNAHNPYDPVKPIDQMTPAEWCDYAKFFLSNPENSEETRRIVIDKMRAKGCKT